jgi:cell wall-associated NlpC family hydrolase
MRGDDVRTLQQDLTTAGYTTAVTGRFNVATKNSVLAFQGQNALSATGVADKPTVAKLVAVVAAKTAATATAPTATPSSTSTTGGAGITGPTSKTTPTTTTPTTTTPTTPSTTTPGTTGGTTLGKGTPPPPVANGYIDANGLAVPPPGAPLVVQQVIAAGNQIAFNPYIFGGGHASFRSKGYDCSGSVSFALHGASLLNSPLDSTEFESWGGRGAGRWITLWANGGHVYMEVAGLWFDTAAQSSTNGNDRWSAARVNSPNGYIERHPRGW